jgi:hypothetical protein
MKPLISVNRDSISWYHHRSLGRHKPTACRQSFTDRSSPQGMLEALRPRTAWRSVGERWRKWQVPDGKPQGNGKSHRASCVPICAPRLFLPQQKAELAERVGFEPTVGFHQRLISSRAMGDKLDGRPSRFGQIGQTMRDRAGAGMRPLYGLATRPSYVLTHKSLSGSQRDGGPTRTRTWNQRIMSPLL